MRMCASEAINVYPEQRSGVVFDRKLSAFRDIRPALDGGKLVLFLFQAIEKTGTHPQVRFAQAEEFRAQHIMFFRMHC